MSVTSCKDLGAYYFVNRDRGRSGTENNSFEGNVLCFHGATFVCVQWHVAQQCCYYWYWKTVLKRRNTFIYVVGSWQWCVGQECDLFNVVGSCACYQNRGKHLWVFANGENVKFWWPCHIRNYYANVPRCYITCTLPILLNSCDHIHFTWCYTVSAVETGWLQNIRILLSCTVVFTPKFMNTLWHCAA